MRKDRETMVHLSLRPFLGAASLARYGHPTEPVPEGGGNGAWTQTRREYSSYNAAVPYSQYSTGYPDPTWSVRYGAGGLLNTPYYYAHTVRNEPATTAASPSKT
ncbi:hypothetical protein BaRGS_00001399 [Batillaria attramentaria]|uniref:Uncharacterized protein n=1 Tax=Batillaria attramentaria TaxID=370345 RepID=A0ABD0M6Q2_9CAEN